MVLLQELQALQHSLDAEFGKEESDKGLQNDTSFLLSAVGAPCMLTYLLPPTVASSSSEEVDLTPSSLFCAACNKLFKSDKA